MIEEVAIGVDWVMFVKDVIEVVRVEEPDKLSSSEVEPWLALMILIRYLIYLFWPFIHLIFPHSDMGLVLLSRIHPKRNFKSEITFTKMGHS